MSAGDPGLVLLVGSIVVLCAVAAARTAHQVGLPGLLVFLGLGLALGQAGLGVRFGNPDLARALGTGGLIVILAEGGLTTNWANARAAAPVAITLATVGVAVSTAIVAASCHWLLSFGWRDALLLGAVLAPTDAAAVFAVLRKLPLPPRLSGVLEAESGLNDAAGVLAVTLLSGAVLTRAPLAVPSVTAAAPAVFRAVVGIVAYQIAVGAVIGAVAGLVGTISLRRLALPASGLYPIAVLAFVIAGYGAAWLAGASGFLAVYVAALVLGNARLPHRPATRGFAEGVAWLAQIGLFIMLGLVASPMRLPSAVVPALIAGSVLLLLARPAAVLVSCLPWRLPWRWQAFLAPAGLRGAVPIVLATIPMSENVPGATRLFDMVFVVVVVFTMIQAPTLPWAAAKLEITRPDEPQEIDIEAAPLETLRAELLQVRIPDGSKLHGVEIFELRLPDEANVALIVRDGQGLVPQPGTTLRDGDSLLVVAAPSVRTQTERRLRAVGRAGKLAGWLGERGL